MPTKHSLEDLKIYHNEAMNFFASELMLLKEVIPKIEDERIAKAAILLISCGQTGAALLQLASHVDTFTSESVMLARAFMEKITNFCYVSICEEKEYRAFILHPIYKQYHNVASGRMEDDLDFMAEDFLAREEKQKQLKKKEIVQEALAMFSDTNEKMNWTKKNFGQRIAVIEKWGKLMDVFFSINKLQYYADASEALHGSLYGCTLILECLIRNLIIQKQKNYKGNFIRTTHAFYCTLVCLFMNHSPLFPTPATFKRFGIILIEIEDTH